MIATIQTIGKRTRGRRARRYADRDYRGFNNMRRHLPQVSEEEYARRIRSACYPAELRAWAACVVFWDLFGTATGSRDDESPLRKLMEGYRHGHRFTDKDLEAVLFRIGYGLHAEARAATKVTNYISKGAQEGKHGGYERRW